MLRCCRRAQDESSIFRSGAALVQAIEAAECLRRSFERNEVSGFAWKAGIVMGCRFFLSWYPLFGGFLKGKSSEQNGSAFLGLHQMHPRRLVHGHNTGRKFGSLDHGRSSWALNHRMHQVLLISLGTKAPGSKNLVSTASCCSLTMALAEATCCQKQIQRAWWTSVEGQSVLSGNTSLSGWHLLSQWEARTQGSLCVPERS